MDFSQKVKIPATPPIKTNIDLPKRIRSNTKTFSKPTEIENIISR